jgi:hypothetical protein
LTLRSGGIECAAVTTRLQTLGNDGVGTRRFGGAGFSERRFAP